MPIPAAVKRRRRNLPALALPPPRRAFRGAQEQAAHKISSLGS